MNILNREIKPEPVSRIAGVRPHVQIIFKLVDEVHSAKVPGLKDRVETKMSFLCLTRMTRRSHHNLLNIPQASLIVAVIRV